jgi:hypothetical protein
MPKNPQQFGGKKKGNNNKKKKNSFEHSGSKTQENSAKGKIKQNVKYP